MPCCASSDSFFFFFGGGGLTLHVFCVGVSLVNLGSKQKKTNVIKKSNNACAQSVLRVMFFPFYLFIYLFLGGAGSTVKACVM